MRRAGTPFVALDRGERSWLYRNPAGEIVARCAAEVRPALARLEAALARGFHCAGYLSYEAGLTLESRLAGLARPQAPSAEPLLWFGIFAQREIVPIAALAPFRPGAAWTGTPEPLVSRQAYGAAFAEAQRLIRAGDIYQINLTFPTRVPLRGHPLDIYGLLRGSAGAPHGAIVRIPGHWFLSYSPELFFALENGAITCRPMKGTAARCAHPREDARAAAELVADPKQRAENLMIVDLLRNDLARIAVPASVKVPRLFDVEHYPTVHQMTSTVTAQLQPGRTARDVLTALFPCGSITGAPKIRAMELIHRLEGPPRGIYTGSIGAFAPDGSASFNVAIRTLSLAEGADAALLGLGSGLVADSNLDDEWHECLQKGAFVGTTTDRLALAGNMAAMR